MTQYSAEMLCHTTRASLVKGQTNTLPLPRTWWHVLTKSSVSGDSTGAAVQQLYTDQIQHAALDAVLGPVFQSPVDGRLN